MVIGSPEFLINRPIILLVLMALPLFLTAKHLKLFPSNNTLYLVAIPFALSIIVSRYAFADNTWTWFFYAAVLIIDIILLSVIFIDGCMAGFMFRAQHFSCSRIVGGTGSQGKKYPVQLRVVKRGKLACKVVVCDDLPPGFTVTPDQFSTTLRPQSNTEFEYEYVSDQRGKVDLNTVYLKVSSPLRLWQIYHEIPAHSSVNVYPDIQQISEYDLLARTNRLSLLGMRRSRSIGQDNEFERLRDYTQDDNYKHIDWRSTARRQKLTVRDYQANQSQQIIFMIDCGRMMTGTHENTDMIDHAMFDPIETFENSPPDLQENHIYEAAAAASILTWRHQLINDLKHQGVLTMDVFPEGLTADLVNQYLHIKARHLL